MEELQETKADLKKRGYNAKEIRADRDVKALNLKIRAIESGRGLPSAMCTAERERALEHAANMLSALRVDLSSGAIGQSEFGAETCTWTAKLKSLRL